MRLTGSRLTVRKMADGERYPFLLGPDGVPLWYPTLFATMVLRNASLSQNTIRGALDAIDAALSWADLRGVDLEERFRSAEYLSSLEVLSLASYLRQSRLAKQGNRSSERGARVVSLERARAGPSPPLPAVSKQVAYQRITYVAKYLEWLAMHAVEGVIAADRDSTARAKAMARQLREERPRTGRASRVTGRREFTEADAKKIRRAVEPGSAENPFTGSVQRRNELIVNLYELGIRRGEMLAIKVEDIDFDDQTILIPRRHNDPTDPRKDAPQAKTYDRRLPITSDLRDRIEDYILQARSRLPRAKTHGFLLVSHAKGSAGGAPLSTVALKKIVAKIASSSGLKELVGHRWRHDTATKQARLMKRNGKSEDEIRRALAYMFGWSETGSTVAVYLKAFIEEEARAASLDLQRVRKA